MEAFWILLLAFQIMYWCSVSTAAKTQHEQRIYGDQLYIRLPTGAEKLQFTSADETKQDVLWSFGTSSKRGTVTGKLDDRRFVINSVTFDDEGIYTVFNYWNKMSAIYLLKVLTKTSLQNCVAGESLSINLAGLPKNDATLRFSSEDFNVTLVERGSPVGNFHPEYMGRIQMTSSKIEVLNVNVSDVGNYTLSDRLNRKIKIVSMRLVDHHEGVSAAPLMSLLMLLGIPPCIFCCCKKKICKKNNQPTTTINTTTTVKYDEQILPPGPPPAYAGFAGPAPAGPTPVYTPGYPPVNESIVHPPPNPIFPPQQPHNGYPATSPAMPPNSGFAPGIYNAPAGPMIGDLPPTTPLLTHPEGYTPGYPAVCDSLVHPPPNPMFPPQQPYISPAMSPNPVPQPPASYAGTNVSNSSDSAVQFNVNMGKDSSVNFL